MEHVDSMDKEKRKSICMIFTFWVAPGWVGVASVIAGFGA
jgi:hypothetical protein